MGQNEKQGFSKKLWDEQVTMWRALEPAVRTAGVSGFISWIKLFFAPFIVFIIVAVIIWNILKGKPRPVKKRKHHGINKYGETY